MPPAVLQSACTRSPESSETPPCRTAADDAQTMRRHTNEQDKALDTINDALGDLQRMGEVSTACLRCAWRCCPGGTHTARSFKRPFLTGSAALADHSCLVHPCTHSGVEAPKGGFLHRQAMPQTSYAYGSPHAQAARVQRAPFAQTFSACCLQAMHTEIKYQDGIIDRVDDKTSKTGTGLQNLTQTARSDHRLGPRGNRRR